MSSGTELFSMVDGRKSDAKLHAELLGRDANSPETNRRRRDEALKAGIDAGAVERWFGKA